MRVLALFTLLTALAAPAAARTHPRRQCKAKHTPSIPRPQESGGNDQPNDQPQPGHEEQPVPSAGTDSAVQPPKPEETPAPAPEEPAPSSAEPAPASSESPAPSSSEPAPSPTEEPAPVETPEPAPGSEADPTPSVAEPTPSEAAPSEASSSEPAPSSEAEPSPTPSPSETPAEPTETPASTTSTAADTAFTQPALTDGAQTGPEAYQQILLDLHNNLRSQYSAGPVTWNQGLADYAAGHAEKCLFEHSGASTGENLAAGTGDGYDLAAEFQMWADEVHAYDFNNPGYSNTTGHFTQAVWKGTSQIGCAWKKCAPGAIFEAQFGESLILVCEYDPRGNYISYTSDEETAKWFSENVGPKA